MHEYLRLQILTQRRQDVHILICANGCFFYSRKNGLYNVSVNIVEIRPMGSEKTSRLPLVFLRLGKIRKEKNIEKM